MTAPSRDLLLSAIEDALGLIRDAGAGQPAAARAPVSGTAGTTLAPALAAAIAPAVAPPLPSLLEQCRTIAAGAAQQADPLRTFHHFACTGGTLISKCLAVLPNTRLLSEIAPLSTIGVNLQAKPRFVPSDLLLHLKTGLRPVPQSDLVDIFLAGLGTLRRQAAARGERLVLRDHAHSQFCVGPDIGDHAPLHRMVAPLGPVRSALLVRHPLDSYLSLLKNGWEHFTPHGIDEYARRYQAFLAAHADMPMFRYEDFVADPGTVLERICDALALPYVPDALDLFSMARISGDSGRKSDRIAARPRRDVPDQVRAATEASTAYHALCAQLGY